MAVLTNTMMQGTAADVGSGDFQIKQSVNMEDEGPTYPTVGYTEARGRFLFTPTREGNRRKGTWSFWTKLNPHRTGFHNFLWNRNKDSADDQRLFIDENDGKLTYYANRGGGATNDKLTTARRLYDKNAWYHIVLRYDTSQSNTGERVQIWINGELQDLDNNDPPAEHHQGFWGAVGYDPHSICGAHMSHAWGAHGHGRAKFADYQYIDGMSLLPAAFGQFDDYGVWQPKALSLPVPNDGTADWVGSSTGTWATATSNAFDGKETNDSALNIAQVNAGNTATITLPGDGIKVNASLRLNMYASVTSFGQYTGIAINGEDYTYSAICTATSGNSGYWFIPEFGGKTLETIAITARTGANVGLGGVEVDGKLLVNGQTDTLTTRGNINDGTVWSDSLALSAGNFHNSHPATYAFNGLISQRSAPAAYNGTHQTFTFPTTLSGSHKIRIYAADGDSNTVSVYINDSDTGINIPSTQANMAWVDLGDRTNVSTIKLHCDNASAISYWGAIEVDGSMLIDNTHDNSFHLKFDDATDLTTLGENSLETIDYSSVNASKGAPILKTNKVGSAVTSGYRTDTHAGTTNDTGLVLAIPGNSVASGTCDVHQQINTGSSNKAVTLIGDPTLDTKKFWNSSKFYGKSIAFNGDDGLSFAGDADFDWGTYTSGTDGDFTLETWIKFNNIGASGSIFDFVDNDGNNSPAGSWFFSSSRGLEWYLGGSNVAIAPSNFTAGHWYHIALVRTGGTLKHFVNGEIKASGSFTGQCGISNKALTIGKFASSSIFFNGSINDFRIYKGVAKYTQAFKVDDRKDWKGENIKVADEDVAQPAGPIRKTNADGSTVESGFFPDPHAEYLVFACPCSDGADGLDLVDYAPTIKGDGSSAKSITNNGLSVATSGKWYGDSAESGGTDKATCQSSDFELSTTDDFTCEFWTYVPTSGLTTHARIFNMTDTSENGIGFAVYSGGAIYPMILGDYIITGGSGTNVTDTAWQNAWAHWAVTRKDGIVYWFLNGALKGQEANTTALPASQNTLSMCAAGYHTAMKIQDVRFYKGFAKYTAAFTIPTQVQPGKRYKDISYDSPTNYDPGDGKVRGNMCVWTEPGWETNSGYSLSNGGTTLISNDNTWKTAVGTIKVNSGKWYYEYEVLRDISNSTGTRVGWVEYTADVATAGDTYAHKNYAYYNNGGSGRTEYNNTADTTNVSGFNRGDVIGCALDLDNNKIYWSKNGTWLNSADPAAGSNTRYTVAATAGEWYAPSAGLYGIGTQGDANFGQKAFKYTVPSGFGALVSTNLPDLFSGDNLNRPDKYFDTHFWRGDGTARSHSGWQFQPELLWMKSRSDNQAHLWYNAIRGVTKITYPDLTNDEDTYTVSLQTFDSDGFSWGTDSYGNQDTKNFFFAGWDAGTTAATVNDAGDIDPNHAWVNATAGFNMLEYTGTGSNATVGHNLGAKPSFVVIKRLTGADADWMVYHKFAGATQNANLDNNTAVQDEADIFNDTEPTNSLFSIGTNALVNASGSQYMMYLWSDIAGFSSFGHWTGNQDKNFINLGFSPALIIFKNFDNNNEWITWAPELRIGKNFKYFEVNNSGGEQNAFGDLTYHSNGFSINCSSAQMNATGNRYMYAAWARHPFKLSRAGLGGSA